MNQKIDRGDYDFEDKVPDINDVNTKLRFRFRDKTEEAFFNLEEQQPEIVEEPPSYVKQQHGLTLYPNGAKEAYLKALEAAQLAKLRAFINLQNRLTRPYVFSYYENVPRKEQPLSGDEEEGEEEEGRELGKEKKKDKKDKDKKDKKDKESEKKEEPVKKEKAKKRFQLKGKRAEMRHIFGKIDPNDYYPGGVKNPFRKKLVYRNRQMSRESSYLTTDRAVGFDRYPQTEKYAPLPPINSMMSEPDHLHVNRVNTGLMASHE